MGMKPRKRIYVVHLQNKTDIQDDDAIRVKAINRLDAKRIASQHISERFYIGEAFTIPEFREWDSYWASLIAGQEPLTA